MSERNSKGSESCEREEVRAWGGPQLCFKFHLQTGAGLASEALITWSRVMKNMSDTITIIPSLGLTVPAFRPRPHYKAL